MSSPTEPAPELHPYRDNPQPPPESARVPVGMRLAGLALVANAVISVVSLVLAPAAALSGAVRSPAAPLVDIVIGALLFTGKQKLKPFATARVVIGGVVFTGLYLAQHDRFGAAVQVALSVSLLGLLVGSPSVARSAVSMSLFGTYAALSIAGAVALRTGHSPLASVIAAASGDYEPSTVRVAQGRAYHYAIALPDGWRLRTEAAARRENALVDRWVSHPESDCHVLVVGERIAPDQSVAPARGLDALVQNSRQNAPDLRVARTGALPGRPEVPFAEGPATVNNLALTFYFAMITNGAETLSVTGFCPRAGGDSMRAAMLERIAAIRPDAVAGHVVSGALSEAGASLGVIEGGALRGRRAAYQLQLPPAWRTFNPPQPDPEVDQWAMLPYEGAQLRVHIEALPEGATMDLDRGLEAMLTERRTALPGERVVARGAFEALGEARYFESELVEPQSSNHVWMVLTVRGNQLFVLTAFTPSHTAEARRDEMLAILRSFRAP